MKNNLATNLKKLRKENNLSQEELADKLGVSRQSVSKWEMGDAYPEMDKIMQISEMFNVSVDSLIHSDALELKNEEKVKNNLNKYIDDFLEFITDTVNMISNMSFKSKIKCFIEQSIIGIILVFFCFIASLFIKELFVNIFYMSNIKDSIQGVLASIYYLFCFILIITIMIHIFKVRYLSYYKELQNKIEITKEENNENIKLKNKDQKIIIRDSKNSNYSFIKGLFKIILFFIKCFSFIFMIFVCLVLISILVATVYSFNFIKSGLFFIGLLLIGISSTIISLIIIFSLINFIFNRLISKKKLIYTFIISLIVFGIGIGLSFTSFTNFEKIDISNKLVKKELIIDMNDDIYLVLENAEYIEEERKDIKIEYSSLDFCNAIVDSSFNNTTQIYQECNEIDALEYFLEGIKEKKLYYNDDYSFTKNIKVYTSKENIEKIKNNIISRENQDTKDLIKDLEKQNNELIKSNESLESKINDLEIENTKLKEEIDNLKENSEN